MQNIQSRRRFLAGAAAASAAGLIGTPVRAFAEGSLETTAIRLAKIAGICIAPQYVAEELLHLEGFTDVSYVVTEAAVGTSETIARGEVGLQPEFCRSTGPCNRCRRPDHDFGGRAYRLLRTVRPTKASAASPTSKARP